MAKASHEKALFKQNKKAFKKATKMKKPYVRIRMNTRELLISIEA